MSARAEPEVAIDLSVTHKELVEIEKQIEESTAKHNAFLKELGLSPLPGPKSVVEAILAPVAGATTTEAPSGKKILTADRASGSTSAARAAGSPLRGADPPPAVYTQIMVSASSDTVCWLHSGDESVRRPADLSPGVCSLPP